MGFNVHIFLPFGNGTLSGTHSIILYYMDRYYDIHSLHTQYIVYILNTQFEQDVLNAKSTHIFWMVVSE